VSTGYHVPCTGYHLYILKRKNTLLWRLEHANREGFSYLFGTMHVRDSKAFGFVAQAKEKILSCEAFATEFNFAEAEHSNIIPTQLPEGMTLSRLLTKRQYQKVQHYFSLITGLPFHLFENSTPLIISNLMAGHILSSDRAVSLDQELWNFAKAEEKILLGVESLEEQMAIFQMIPLKVQVQSLVKSIKSISQFKKATLKSIEVYQSGDIVKLYKMAKKGNGKLRKILLYDRNQIMASRITRLIEEQNIFIAIGAGHLAGSKGDIKLPLGAALNANPSQLSST